MPVQHHAVGCEIQKTVIEPRPKHPAPPEPHRQLQTMLNQTSSGLGNSIPNRSWPNRPNKKQHPEIR